MNEQEWDEFASDYYLNQIESQTKIVEDVIAYLKDNGVLPTHQVVDISGGSGRYLSMAKEAGIFELVDFSAEMLKFAKIEANKLGIENVHFTKRPFKEFLKQPKVYDLVFTAANPALDNFEKLEQLLSKTKKTCVIIRVVDSKDDLFLPLEKRLGIFEEDPNTSPHLMDQFANYLKQKKYSYQIKEFTYDVKEEISRLLIENYYEEYKNDPQLITYLDQQFQKNEHTISTTKLTYRMLLIQNERS